MSILSRLFGVGGSKAEVQAEPHTYEGFRIFAEPVKETSGWRLTGRIEKEVGGTLKTHDLIRADTLDNRDLAVEATIAKAEQVIDQMGERLFD